MKNNNFTSDSSIPSKKKIVILIFFALLCIASVIVIFLHLNKFDVFINVEPGTVSSELNINEPSILLYTDPLCGSCSKFKKIVSELCKEKKIKCKLIEAPSLKDEDVRVLNMYKISRVPSLILIHDQKIEVVNENLDEDSIKAVISIY